ncbi:hypothetical protein WN51_01595 [Melipona quadrifasciata]|uniref:Uncharacterized protein n=1 Tax=Melipona quadrifasciata TaxID=166423 RepID=A0A0N0BE95_9HYME|nr:hypothetical protein WN51_01595 [Melipona quadrifasciata]
MDRCVLCEKGKKKKKKKKREKYVYRKIVGLEIFRGAIYYIKDTDDINAVRCSKIYDRGCSKVSSTGVYTLGVGHFRRWVT